jgi:hypothetical protein
MSENKRIGVAFANMSKQFIELEVIKKWKPTQITKTGVTVFFNVDGEFASMKTSDYNQIFET